MVSHIAVLAVFAVCTQSAWAAVAETEKDTPRTASQDARACAGVANEGLKMKELRRELVAYVGEALPEDLQRRLNQHVEKVARAKAECDQQRGQAAASR